jgi:predicted nuclease of predicted toxin-antitoxin system
MKFLADENFPRRAVLALREQGFDVAWVSEDRPGASDDDILARCSAGKLTLLTLDKDFGELVFRRGLPAEWGVILFRAETKSPAEFAQLAAAALGSRDDWSGLFTVVRRDRIRITPLTRLGAGQ